MSFEQAYIVPIQDINHIGAQPDVRSRDFMRHRDMFESRSRTTNEPMYIEACKELKEENTRLKMELGTAHAKNAEAAKLLMSDRMMF